MQGHFDVSGKQNGVAVINYRELNKTTIDNKYVYDIILFISFMNIYRAFYDELSLELEEYREPNEITS